MSTQKRKDEIIRTLFNNDKSKKWLQSKLDKKLDNSVDVYYMLSDRCKTMDVEVSDAITEVFKASGIIATPNEQCDKLVEQIFHLDGMVGHALTILNSNIYEFTKDNVLDFQEKKKLSQMLDKIEAEYQREIEKARKIIEA